jgi:NAD(P)H-dependent flavin oxidoreductase YrpB (nitropropane dioxygenase family)
MIETRLTKLLRIRHPIVCGTMHLVTGPEMVAAVANAGALGILYTSAVSSGREPPPPALLEPYVTISRHTAPAVRPCGDARRYQ